MKKVYPKLIATAAILAIGAARTEAALIVYEGFDAAQLVSLPSVTGGTGWTTDWDSASWRTNFSGFGEIGTGLTYSTLPTLGNAARNENNFNQSFREFAMQPATGTYWISFLMQKDDTSINSFGISLFDGPNEKNFLGNANSDTFSVAGAGAFASTMEVTTATASFFVAKYDMTAGLAHFWINPSLDVEPSLASALNGVDGTAFTAFQFNRIRLGKFNDGSGYLDEIRIGTLATDVGVIPEPSAFAALAGVCVLGMAAVRRRRTR